MNGVAGAIQASARRLTAGQRRDQLFAVALGPSRAGLPGDDHGRHRRGGRGTKPLLYQHFSSSGRSTSNWSTPSPRSCWSAISKAVPRADGPRQQVELGFAAYFRLVVTHEAEFRLLYGRDHADDEELGGALRAVEDAIAEAIDPLIAAGLDDDHRRLLAYAIVGMAEGASRRFIAQRAADVRAPTSKSRPSGWPSGWPTWPGPGCAPCTPTDLDGSRPAARAAVRVG